MRISNDVSAIFGRLNASQVIFVDGVEKRMADLRAKLEQSMRGLCWYLRNGRRGSGWLLIGSPAAAATGPAERTHSFRRHGCQTPGSLHLPGRARLG